MSPLSRELVFLILQFLEEEKFKESVHKREKESAFFFNMKYFEEKVHAGDWEEVEKYLSGFTKVLFVGLRKNYLFFVIGGQEGDFMAKPGSPIFKFSRRNETICIKGVSSSNSANLVKAVFFNGDHHLHYSCSDFL